MAQRTSLDLWLSALLIITYISVLVVISILFPSGKELIDFLSSIYGRFGYEIVFIGAMLEALIVINFFVPGVAAVGLGAVFAKAGELNLVLTILAAVLGALSGFSLDYILGKFGFATVLEKIGKKENILKMERQLGKYRFRTFSLGFIHPNIGAFVALAAGSLGFTFNRFITLSFVSTLIWYSIWGFLIFLLGSVFIFVLTRYIPVLIVIIILFWILGLVYDRVKEGK